MGAAGGESERETIEDVFGEGTRRVEHVRVRVRVRVNMNENVSTALLLSLLLLLLIARACNYIEEQYVILKGSICSSTCNCVCFIYNNTK